MTLPAAVARKAKEAGDIIKARGASAPAPAGTPAGDPEAELRKQLATAQAELTRLQAANTNLQGKYNAEVPRLAGEIRELKTQLQAAQDEKTRRIEAGEVDLTDDDRAVIGAEAVPIFAKLIRQVATQELETRLKPLSERVDSFQRMTEAQYLATLTHLVPAWELQNEDKAFQAWLQEVDPATQRLRNDLLQTAHGAQQGYRVAEVFRAFLEHREIGARQSAEPGAGLNLAHAAEGGDPVVVDEHGGKIWARSEISAFYNDRRAGKYRGREEESRKIEADIFAAQKENRIR